MFPCVTVVVPSGETVPNAPVVERIAKVGVATGAVTVTVRVAVVVLSARSDTE